MNYLKKYNKKIIFLLGFFSALPFFFIPYKPFIYINKYYTESVWEGVPLFHPGYTSSIGLASPFLLLFLTIFVCFKIFIFKYKKENLGLTILSGLMVILNTLILFFLSSSIKSFGASFGLFGLLIIVIFMNNFDFKIFCKGYLISLTFFINLHVLSFFVSGIQISYSFNGISIFGIEIYQSLVSYVYVVTFFFGTLILKKNKFTNLIKFENKKINLILYYITLTSCFIIIIILERRFAFLILLFSLFILFIIYFKNNKYKISMRSFLVLTIFFVCIFISKFFFTYKYRGINYVEMVQPRFNTLVDNMTNFFYLRGNDLYFGKLKGWGNIESGLVDLLLNVGLAGLLSYLFTFTFLIYFMYQKLNFLILKKNISYIFFSFCVLFFSNIVNNSISLPYFFISFFIILIFFLDEKIDNGGVKTVNL
jgi:hypothetical protein